MASLLGYCTVLLPMLLQWFVGMIVANEKTIPVWTWLDGSTLVNQPSTLTAGKQYPGCRADSSIWTHPTDGVVWMFGGKEGSGMALNELWLYDVPSLEWTNIRRGKEQEWPRPRYGAAMCGVASSSLVIYGGAESEENLLSDTWLYHLHNESWTPLAGSSHQPDVRVSVAHWCTHSAVWAYGGTTSDPATPLPMWRFSLQSYKWTEVRANVGSGKSQVTNGVGQGRGSATWVVNGTQLYLLGRKPSSAGESCQGKKNSTSSECDLWRFSTASHQWEHIAIDSGGRDGGIANNEMVELSGQPSCSAQEASWLDANNNLWLLGNGPGTCEKMRQSKSDLWMLDIRLMSWTHFKSSGTAENHLRSEEMPDIPSHPPQRAFCASWSWNTTFYLFGGLARNGTVGALNDLWDFRLMTVENLHSKPALAVPPVAVFFMSLGALCVLSLFVFGVIFFSKCSSGPRLKPPNHFGDKIRYSPVETDEVFIT